MDLVAQLLLQGADPVIVWDQKQDRWDTGSRSMAVGTSAGADWHMVVQDDVILCDGFVQEAQKALAMVQDGPVAFYMGRGHLEGLGTVQLVRRARQGAYRWLRGRGPLWGPAVAIRPADIAPMLEWGDARQEPANYDLRMALYFRKIGRTCLYSIPSLVDHRTGHHNPSLVPGRGSSSGRRAAWFEQKPARLGDWTAAALTLDERDNPRRRAPRIPPPPPATGSTDRVCAVLVPAWKAFPYLEWCLESIEKQLPLAGWRYELRLGVDACIETAWQLGRLGIPFWWNETNVGPYIMRNSLAALGPADAYATFDADDQMKPEYLSSLIPLACPSIVEGRGVDGIAGSRRLELEMGGRLDRGRQPVVPSPWTCGVAVYSKTAWEELDGFRAWRIAADHDLVLRAKAKNIPIHQHHGLPKALFYRRIHGESLTQRRETGMESDARNQAKTLARELVIRGDLAVKLETVPLRFIGGDRENAA